MREFKSRTLRTEDKETPSEMLGFFICANITKIIHNYPLLDNILLDNISLLDNILTNNSTKSRGLWG